MTLEQKIFDLLRYDPDTGKLYWKADRANRKVKAGDEAGSLTSHGYFQVDVCGKSYIAHRLAWLLHYGEWPKQQIDHIDGVKTNNRVTNLRDVDHKTNNENLRKPKSHNTSGFLGVSPREGRWRARIKCGGKDKHLGYYPTPEQAHEAYLTAKRKLHQGATL